MGGEYQLGALQAHSITCEVLFAANILARDADFSLPDLHTHCAVS